MAFAGMIISEKFNLFNFKSFDKPIYKMDILNNKYLLAAVFATVLRALMKVTSKYSALTMNILNKSNVLLLESPITEKGVDKEILLANNYRDLTKLISAWKENGWDVKLKRKKYIQEEDIKTLDVFEHSGFFDLNVAKELLTEKQFLVFSKASDWGYYEDPKKITLDELLTQLDIGASTVAEHLRKAESKLIPILLKMIRKL